MADSLKASFDLSGWDSLLDRLNGEARESIARQMGVAGGQVLRDEAKTRVPDDWASRPHNPKSRGSQQAGTLADAIYLSRDDKATTATAFSYKISWNNSEAWWGKLIEFGHWQTEYKYEAGADLYWSPKGKGKGQRVRWIPAEPFLGSAYDAALGRARGAMIEAGRRAAQRLLSGGSANVV